MKMTMTIAAALLAFVMMLLVSSPNVATFISAQTQADATTTVTGAASANASLIAAPAIIWPSSIAVVDLDEASGLAAVQVSLQFTAAQAQTWLPTSTVEIGGKAPLYDQPFGLQATFGGILPADQVKLINELTLNITIKSSKCFSPNADDQLVIRFGAATAAVRVRNPSTLETRDVTGNLVPESFTTVTAEVIRETRTAGLGVIALTFALICLLFLLSDWTQATVSFMQLQWITMLSMQTCVPLSTSGITQNSHFVLWPLSARLEPAHPEYAFRQLFNMLVMLFVLVLELVMIGAFMFFGKDRITAMQRVRFPSTLGVALAVLLPSGCMYASTQVFSLLASGAHAAGGVQVTYAVVSLLLTIVYLVLVCTATFTVVSRLIYRDLQPRVNRTWFTRLTSPDGEWLVEDTVSARWGLLFDSYSVRGFWAFAAFQIITFLFAVASGPAPSTQTGCRAKAYMNLVTAVILAALHVVRKPFNNAMSNLTNTIVALSIVVLCVGNASSHSCSSKARIFSSACAWGALLVLCVKVLAHCMLTAYSSANQLLFAAEQRAAAAARAAGSSVEDDDADEAGLVGGGRLLTPFGGTGGAGGTEETTIPLDAYDAFELKLFHGAENTGATNDTPSMYAAGLANLVSASGGDNSNNGVGAGFGRSVGLAPASKGGNQQQQQQQVAGLRPVLGNPVMVAGAFLRREVGFGKMGGLRGSAGPSLVIQLHAPVCCAVTSAGVVIVVEAGFRGVALGRNSINRRNDASSFSSSAANNNNNGSNGGSNSMAAMIPKDAKPRILAHAPDSRRAEEIQMRDAALLREAFMPNSAGGGKGSRSNNNNNNNRSQNSPGGAGSSTGDGSSNSPGGDRTAAGVANAPDSADSANNNNNNIKRRLSVGGKSATTSSLLKLPSACCAGQACIFVCDADEGSVVRVDLVSGLVSTVIADLLKPSGVAVFGDALYVSDTLRHRVLAVDLLAGKVTVFAGTGASGFDADGTPASQSRLNCPQGLFVCSDTGELFICDSCNHRVVCVPLSLRMMRTVMGIPGVIGGDMDNGSEESLAATSRDSGGLRRARETALAMPTQVIARVAPEAQLLDVGAAAVELFVIESGGVSRIWHVSRFGFAHVVLPANEFVMPHAMCLAPAPARFQSSAESFVSPARYDHNNNNSINKSVSVSNSSGNVSNSSAFYSPHRSSSVELLVVDTALQIVARVSIPSLQPAAPAERIPEFSFALLPPAPIEQSMTQQQQQQQNRMAAATSAAAAQGATSRQIGAVSLSAAMSPAGRQDGDSDAAILATL